MFNFDGKGQAFITAFPDSGVTKAKKNVKAMTTREGSGPPK